MGRQGITVNCKPIVPIYSIPDLGSSSRYVDVCRNLGNIVSFRLVCIPNVSRYHDIYQQLFVGALTDPH